MCARERYMQGRQRPGTPWVDVGSLQDGVGSGREGMEAPSYIEHLIPVL